MDQVSPTAALIFGLLIGIVMWISGGLVIDRHKGSGQTALIAGILAMAAGVACVVFGVLAITDVMSGSAAMLSIGASAVAGTILLVAFLVIANVEASRASRAPTATTSHDDPPSTVR